MILTLLIVPLLVWFLTKPRYGRQIDLMEFKRRLLKLGLGVR